MTTPDSPEQKQYADRHPTDLEPHYSRHVLAMTAEALHSKAAIAAELAYRDSEIQRLIAELAELREKAVAPCKHCGKAPHWREHPD